MGIEVNIGKKVFGNFEIPYVRADENATLFLGKKVFEVFNAVEFIGKPVPESDGYCRFVDKYFSEDKVAFENGNSGLQSAEAQSFFEIIGNVTVAFGLENEVVGGDKIEDKVGTAHAKISDAPDEDSVA